MIGVIDYGIGNIMSIVNMFKKLDVNCIVVNQTSEIELCSKIILPGIGSFDHGMQLLNKSGLKESIDNHVKLGKPILGICLGMQMLGNSSEEGQLKGLGYIDFITKKYKFDDHSIRIPHMGWNNLSYINYNAKITVDIDQNSRYYFVHSYYAKCRDEKNIMFKTDYYGDFSSGVFLKKISLVFNSIQRKAINMV